MGVGGRPHGSAWGDRPPRTAAKTLQAIVSRLRAALPCDADIIVWRDGGYALQVVPDTVEALRFRALVDAGSRRLRRGDPQPAAAQLRLALGLWRAQEPADLGDTALAAAVRASLTEARLTAVEDRVAAELALGRHTDLLAELEELVEAHPFRERFVERLVLALYRSGQQPQALDMFRRVRGRLRRELGWDPSPALGRLRSRSTHTTLLGRAAADTAGQPPSRGVQLQRPCRRARRALPRCSMTLVS